MWTLDDEERVREIDEYGAHYCTHGISLDEKCDECEEESEFVDEEDVND